MGESTECLAASRVQAADHKSLRYRFGRRPKENGTLAGKRQGLDKMAGGAVVELFLDVHVGDIVDELVEIAIGAMRLS